MTSCSLRMMFALAFCFVAVTQVHGFCAFVQQQQPPAAALRTKPLNMTRKAAKPPQAAWDQIDQHLVVALFDEADLVEEWDFPLEYLDEGDDNVVDNSSESSMDNNNKNNLAWGLARGILAQKKDDILAALPRVVLPFLMQQQLAARGGNQEEPQRFAFVPRSTVAVPPSNQVASIKMAADLLSLVVAARQQPLLAL